MMDINEDSMTGKPVRYLSLEERADADTGPAKITAILACCLKMLHGKMEPLATARMLEMSKRLVNEYIALFEEHRTIEGEGNHVS